MPFKSFSPQIHVSFLGVLPSSLDKVLEQMDGVDAIHLDVMDGVFVPYHGLTIEFIHLLSLKTDVFLSCHLMVQDPFLWIEKVKNFSIDQITIHFESTQNLLPCLKKIRDYGFQAGVALSPSTPVNVLLESLPYVNTVLVMGVEPGRGGQSFLPTTLQKISELYVYKQDFAFSIQVDGGIQLSNIVNILNAGAEHFVVGSALLQANNPIDILKKFQNLLKNPHTTFPHN